MRYAADHKAITREKVLAVAGAALRRHGPNGVAVAGIMAEAGLTHGGFYAHFRSKDDLVAAAIDAMFEDGRNRFARATEGHTPAEGLARYIDFYLSPRHRDARDSGCPLAALNSDLPRLTEASRERYTAGIASLTTRLATLVAGDTPLATSIVSELVGALALSRTVTDAAQSDLILEASKAALKARLNLPSPSRGEGDSPQASGERGTAQ